MLIVTADYIAGKDIEMLGLVRGSTIKTKNVFKDIGSGFKMIIGGEMKNYTQMMDDARETATNRMVEDARMLGADAIVGARYYSASVIQGAAEAVAYGTAVKYI